MALLEFAFKELFEDEHKHKESEVEDAPAEEEEEDAPAEEEDAPAEEEEEPRAGTAAEERTGASTRFFSSRLFSGVEKLAPPDIPKNPARSTAGHVAIPAPL